jgi:hypothetical protein
MRTVPSFPERLNNLRNVRLSRITKCGTAVRRLSGPLKASYSGAVAGSRLTGSIATYFRQDAHPQR